MFSKKKPTWNTVLSTDGQPRIFEANHDAETERRHHFKNPILTQYIKIVPAYWEKNINMRIEPLGCFLPYRKFFYFNLIPYPNVTLYII